MSGSRWVTTPSWLSGSLRAFLYSSSVCANSSYSLLLLMVFAISVLYWAHLCMKCSLDMCNFPEEISAAAVAKSLQSCPTLCDPIDGLPPGSPVPGILQGRILEWVTISFSNAWKWKVKVKSLQHIRLFATPWTAAHQTPPSMGFSKQEYWSGVPLPSLWLGKIKGKRRGWQRRRWLDSITNSLNMNLSKF